ncbi:hypothetical protein BC829DRAFT_386887 [Chytridium lagenaria]|nr:hypothetical protein BC829DRAFT_386887 [Chytridium lagenaria]
MIFWVVLVFLLLIVIGSWLLRRQSGSQKRVAVVVLGDIGRSPRMQYHALSLSQNGFFVDLVGYSGSAPLRSLTDNNNVNIHYLKPPQKIQKQSAHLYIAAGIARVVRQVVEVMDVLFRMPKPHYMLVQTPPAIPTLVIVQIVSILRGCRLVIDWHNFGYSIMQLNLGRENTVVRFAKRYEKLFGSWAYAHLCVTEAMRRELIDVWKVRGQVIVFYDKPPPSFRRLELDEIHKFMGKLILETSYVSILTLNTSPKSTIITESEASGEVRPKKGRPAVVDFGVLLEACAKYDRLAASGEENLPEIILIITGKGPQQEMYMEKVKKLNLKACRIYTAWLPIEDYPKLLGSADLGISLHISSSGLDLPMKIVDMFGCGLPVCAYSYKTLSELVKDGVNGTTFRDADQLCDQMTRLLRGFPDTQDHLTSLRQGIITTADGDWATSWTSTLQSLFL